MRGILLTILLFITVTALGQTPQRFRQTLTDSTRVKNLPTHPSPVPGYGTYYSLGDSAWFLDQNNVRHNLLQWMDSLSTYYTKNQCDSILSALLTPMILFEKTPDSTVRAKYPLDLAALRPVPDSRITAIDIPVLRAPYGDTISATMRIDDKRVLMLYGISDGAGGLVSYGVKSDGNLDVTGTVSGSNLNKSYEYELTADAENNLAVGFTLLSTTKVFYNGVAIPAGQWSGVGTTTLILAVDRRKYDKVLVTN